MEEFHSGQEPLSKGNGCDIHLEPENEDKREGSLDFTSLNQVSDQSTLVDNPGAYGYSNGDYLINGNQNGHKLGLPSLPLPQFEMGKKETEFYIDKAVTEVELPKMIVCYKKESYHILKDICVDESLHSFDNVMVQNATKDENVYNESRFDAGDFTNKHISDSLKLSSLNGQPTFDVNNEVSEHASLGSLREECGDIPHTGETISGGTQADEVLFPPQESDRCQSQDQIIDICNENATQRSLASLLEEDRGNTVTSEEIVLASETKEVLPTHEPDGGQCHADLLTSVSNIDQPQLVNSDIGQPKSGNSDSEESQSNQADSHQLKSVSSNCPDLASECTAQSFSVHDGNRDQVDEGALEEANSKATSGVSSEELKEENKAKDLNDSGGNIVAFDFDSEPPTTILKEDSKAMSEIQQSGLATNSSMLEDTSTDGPTSSSRTSVSHSHADANFLGPASLSGRIAYSGQVPYSGSISLRSDSSTTSTRSFAFPILQSEWNSSPVRMAKADRRHFRRRRGWRSGLLCCRF